MTNAERIYKEIEKHGSKNILIHTVPGTPYWIVCEKIEIDKWFLTLCDPMASSMFNLGTIDNKNHINLWKELINLEIERKLKNLKKYKNQ